MNNNNDNNRGGGLIILAVIAASAFVSWVIRVFRKHRINKHTKKIVIMGGVGSGKTTLWKQLRGETLRYEYEPTSGEEDVSKFTFSTKRGRKIYVEKTKDMGGADDYVKYFRDLLVDGTFVFLLVDLTKLNAEAHDQIFAMLNMIKRTLNLKSKGAGLKILATHFNDYSRRNKTREDAKHDVKEFLGHNKLKKYSDKSIEVVELRDEADIEKVKEEIANS